MTIIKLSDTHYIVVDDSEIKVGDIVAEKLLTGGYELFEIHTLNDIDEVRQKKVTHSNQPLENINFVDEAEGKIIPKIKPLSLFEVEEAIYGYSTYELFKKIDGSCEKGQYEHWLFEQGFNAHKELVKDKLFTVEQMNEVIAEAWNSCEDNEGETYTQVHKRIIQSLLPKTEWECIIDEQGKLKLI